MKFITKNSSQSILHIVYKEKYIEQTVNTKFLGLQTNNHINCKDHVEETITKLRGACYAIRSRAHISNIDTPISIYYAYFYSIKKYGIILPTAGRFALYKRKLPELWLAHNPEPLVEVFKQFKILPVPCQYILSLMNFIINNWEIFQKIHLYTILIPGITIILTNQMPTYLILKKSTFYTGIKIFDSLPPSVTINTDKAKFKAALRKYLHTQTFYSADGFFMCKDDLHFSKCLLYFIM